MGIDPRIAPCLERRESFFSFQSCYSIRQGRNIRLTHSTTTTTAASTTTTSASTSTTTTTTTTTAATTTTVRTTVTQPNQIIVVEPQEKTLACGEVGTGALANVSDILEAVKLCIPDS